MGRIANTHALDFTTLANARRSFLAIQNVIAMIVAFGRIDMHGVGHAKNEHLIRQFLLDPRPNPPYFSRRVGP